MKEEFVVSGMHCNSCVEKVKNALEQGEQVDHVEVTLSPPKATITSHKHIERNSLNDLIKAAGKYQLTEQKSQEPIELKNEEVEEKKPDFSLKTYYPLILIFLFISGFSLIAQLVQPGFDGWLFMRHFMAGFFIVFSFFKLLDLKAFAYAYQGYDIIARKSFSYAMIYPFIELTLGILYFIDFNPLITNLSTVIIMGIGTIGVVRSILNKNTIQCACLGTVFNLPMSKVTLVEDLLMVAMAGFMFLRMVI